MKFSILMGFFFISVAPALCEEPCSKSDLDARIDKAVESAFAKYIEQLKPLTDREVFIEESRQRIKKRGSFGNMLLDDTKNQAILFALGSTCGEFIKKIYQRGDTLWSWAIYQKSKIVTDYITTKKDLVFYHYSRSSEYRDLLRPSWFTSRKSAHEVALKDESYGKIFEYHRTNPKNQGNMYWQVHYVAADPDSSSYFGPIQSKLFLNPKSRVVKMDYGWDDGFAEILNRNPGLDTACPKASSAYNNLMYIVAEDSNIDLLDYSSGNWFQLVSPDSIEKTEVNDCLFSGSGPFGLKGCF